MPYPVFDRSRLHLLPLDQREHDVVVDDLYQLDGPVPPFESEELAAVAQRMVAARRRGAAVILMMGAQLVKAGLSRFVIDLLRRGIVSHVAGNGAVAIHDTELAMIGATSGDEVVRKFSVLNSASSRWILAQMVSGCCQARGIRSAMA